jgi:hypothetical protein
MELANEKMCRCSFTTTTALLPMCTRAPKIADGDTTGKIRQTRITHENVKNRQWDGGSCRSTFRWKSLASPGEVTWTVFVAWLADSTLLAQPNRPHPSRPYRALPQLKLYEKAFQYSSHLPQAFPACPLLASCQTEPSSDVH